MHEKIRRTLLQNVPSGPKTVPSGRANVPSGPGIASAAQKRILTVGNRTLRAGLKPCSRTYGWDRDLWFGTGIYGPEPESMVLKRNLWIGSGIHGSQLELYYPNVSQNRSTMDPQQEPESVLNLIPKHVQNTLQKDPR